jgi:hypothetical protein
LLLLHAKEGRSNQSPVVLQRLQKAASPVETAKKSLQVWLTKAYIRDQASVWNAKQSIA